MNRSKEENVITALRTMGAALAVLSLLAPAQAQSPAEFYAGRQLTLVSGSASGGTYDLYARAIGRHLGKHVPGNPRVLVQNMPGAATYTAALHVMKLAPQDGSVIGALAAALPYQTLVDPNSPPLDVPRINWLPSVSTFTVVTAVRPSSGFTSLEDLKAKPSAMATIAPGQLPSLIVASINDVLGTRIKAVNGHQSMNAAMLSLERGELDGYPAIPVDALKRLYADQLSKKQLKVLLQYGPAPSPDHPDAPYTVNLTTNPADRALIELAQAPLKIGYIYMMGPGVPKDRLDAIRDAFMRTFKDPDFIADCDKQILNIDPVSADRVKSLIEETYKTAPEVVARMRDLYRKTFQ